MNIEEIKNKSIWNDFFIQNNSPSFLQSWEWGELQKGLGYRVERLGIYKDKSLRAIAQVILVRSKRGSFLFIPHGPIFQSAINNEQLTIKFLISQLLHYLTTTAKNENFSFIRIAPILENTKENNQIFQNLGLKKAPIYMHAERVWVLPLSVETRHASSLQIKTDDELLAAMRKTTRYLIRKAIRDGVTIERRTDEKAVDDFYKIYLETAEREKFAAFSKEFIKREFEAFSKTGNTIFLFGSAPKTYPTSGVGNSFTSANSNQFQQISTSFNYLAAALIIFTKSTAFYHQGASIHTKAPVTYLLQWEAIKEAKRRDCHFYNFWGTLIPGRTPKSWGGLTLFKQGFGGEQIDYLPTQDYIINQKYYFTYIYEKILGWRRGV